MHNSDIQRQIELLGTHRQNVQHYLQQVAALGAPTPVAVLNGLNSARTSIAQIKENLRRYWSYIVEDDPDDTPPEPSAPLNRVLWAPGLRLRVAHNEPLEHPIWFVVQAYNRSTGWAMGVLVLEGRNVASVKFHESKLLWLDQGTPLVPYCELGRQ